MVLPLRMCSARDYLAAMRSVLHCPPLPPNYRRHVRVCPFRFPKGRVAGRADLCDSEAVPSSVRISVILAT